MPTNDLSHQQKVAIEWLLDGHTQQEVAQHVGVPVERVRGWLQEPSFQLIYRKERIASLNSAVGDLVDHLVHPTGKAETPASEQRPPPADFDRHASYDDTVSELVVAPTPKDVATLLVRYACHRWSRAVLLIVRKVELLSTASAGHDIDERFVGTVPLWKDSSFTTALREQKVFRGVLSKIEPHSTFVHGISKTLAWPQESMIYPLTVANKSLALLYADRREQGARATDSGDVYQLCEMAAGRLVNLLDQRRFRHP